MIQSELKAQNSNPIAKLKGKNNQSHLFLSLQMETRKILIILTILLPVITTLKKPGDKKGFTTKPKPRERDIDES